MHKILRFLEFKPTRFWTWLKDGAELLLLTDKLLAENLPHFYSQKAFIHSFCVYPSLDLVCLVRYFYLYTYPLA